jgi:hypothetical protein
MRLLVTGGRHLDDVALIHRALTLIHAAQPLCVVIHGGHALAGVAIEDWARDMRLHVLRYPANWREFGKRAESIRNDFMLADSRPDLVLALPGGDDTRALVLSALSRRLPVFDHKGQPMSGCPAGGHALRPEADPEPKPGRSHRRRLSAAH